jgi:hypothetical protein
VRQIACLRWEHELIDDEVVDVKFLDPHLANGSAANGEIGDRQRAHGAGSAGKRPKRQRAAGTRHWTATVVSVA